MYAVKILLACSVLIIICHAEKIIFDEEITVDEIVRTFTQGRSTKISQRLMKSGHATNCGPKETHLNITWTPEVIIIGQDAKVYFNMTTVTSLSVGTATVQVFVGNSTAGTPMFEISDSRSCTDLQKYVTFLKCPIKKGLPIFFSYTKQMEQLPNGVYSAKVSITNEKNELFACVELTVTLKAPDS